jgi:hypothetical protein
MIEASGDEEDEGEGYEDEEYGEDGDDVTLTEGSEQQEEDDNAEEEEDAWNAAPAPAVATHAIRQAWNRAGRRAAAAQQQQDQQQQQTLGFSTAVPLLMPEQRRRPGACSFLQRGVMFEGCQRLSTQQGARRREEQWTVSVVIQVSSVLGLLWCWVVLAEFISKPACCPDRTISSEACRCILVSLCPGIVLHC